MNANLVVKNTRELAMVCGGQMNMACTMRKIGIVKTMFHEKTGEVAEFFDKDRKPVPFDEVMRRLNKLSGK